MSSHGKRPKRKVFFYCDGKKCPNCSRPKTGCMHTSDPAHALSLEGEFRQNLSDGSMWQCNISLNGEIYNDSKGSGLIRL